MAATVYFDGRLGKWFEAETHVAFEIPAKDFGEEAASAEGGFTAPMNGTVVSVAVKPGAQVEAGAVLVVMEAMKMEHSIKAPHDGNIAEVFFSEGDLVDEGSELLSFADED